jgi:hypothetical protein
MRTHLIGLALVLFTARAFAAEKDITIAADGADVLKLSVPETAEVSKNGHETTIKTKTLRIYLWSVPKAQTVDEVLPRVGELIKDEFTDFVIKSTDTVKMAGTEAKHLMGKGAEADDGDPGTADVVVFAVGKHMFVACVHGEREEAAKERPDFLKVLESAKPL